eukprot:gene8221-9068_t
MENEKKRSREWESPLSPSAEIDESYLTLEERRRLNIERNRRFFEQLNFPMGLQQDLPDPLSPAPALTEKTNPKAVLEERLKRLKGLMEAMPHRKEQIESVWQYVSTSNVLVRRPLYIYGPRECGKLTVVQAVLTVAAAYQAVLVVDGSLCRTPQQLLSALILAGKAAGVMDGKTVKTLHAWLRALGAWLRGQGRSRAAVILRHLPDELLEDDLLFAKQCTGCAGLDLLLLRHGPPRHPSMLTLPTVSFPAYTAVALTEILCPSQRSVSEGLSPMGSKAIGGSKASSLEQRQRLCRQLLVVAAASTACVSELRNLLQQLELNGSAGIGEARQSGQALLTAAHPSLHSLPPPPVSGGAAGGAWMGALPLRTRCLLIAAFLAAHNPSASDNLTLLGDTVRQRRRASNREENASKASDEGRGGLQLFSVERLLSVYAQLFHRVQGVSIGDYSDTSTHAMIGMLQRRGLLFAGPGGTFKVQVPRYGCRLSQAVADQLARSMGLVLGDYLYHGQPAHFSFR